MSTTDRSGFADFVRGPDGPHSNDRCFFFTHHYSRVPAGRRRVFLRISKIRVCAHVKAPLADSEHFTETLSAGASCHRVPACYIDPQGIDEKVEPDLPLNGTLALSEKRA